MFRFKGNITTFAPMAEMDAPFTLDGFRAQHLEDWKAQATKDLKGASLDTLDWEIEAGLVVPAYLTSVPKQHQPLKPAGEAPNAWRIATRIKVEELSNAHDAIMRALEGGVSELQLQVSATFDQWEPLLKGVYLDMVALRISGANKTSLLALLALVDQQAKAAVFEAYFHAPRLDCTAYPKVRNVAVSGASSKLVMQLGNALVQSKQALFFALSKGRTIDDVSAKIHWTLPVSSLYFPEMAKFRAARALYAKLIEAYEPEHACTKVLNLSAVTAPYGPTEDVHTNLLRGTTAGLAAVAAGVDSLFIAPYDNTHDTPEFPRMLSRNIQHVLWQESHLAEVSDPANGSFYIEQLTQELCRLAWSHFQNACAK